MCPTASPPPPPAGGRKLTRAATADVTCNALWSQEEQNQFSISTESGPEDLPAVARKEFHRRSTWPVRLVAATLATITMRQLDMTLVPELQVSVCLVYYFRITCS